MSKILVNELAHTNNTSAFTVDTAGRLSIPNQPMFQVVGNNNNIKKGHRKLRQCDLCDTEAASALRQRSARVSWFGASRSPPVCLPKRGTCLDKEREAP